MIIGGEVFFFFEKLYIYQKNCEGTENQSCDSRHVHNSMMIKCVYANNSHSK